MDLTAISSINNYAKQLSQQTQWKLKQESGDVSDHKKTLKDWLERTETARDKNDFSPAARPGADQGQEDKDDTRLRTIMYRVYAGKKLSSQDEQYLLQKDPLSYKPHEIH